MGADEIHLFCLSCLLFFCSFFFFSLPLSLLVWCWQIPILQGREPGACASDSKLGLERASELSAIVNQFILRRTNVLLSKHLPPKVTQIVCCKLTPLQARLYQHLCRSKEVKKLLHDGRRAKQVCVCVC